MNHLRVLTARALTAFLFFVLVAVHAQTPADPNAPAPGRPLPVKTILLITSYPVADLVTSNFFDAFRKGIRELNLPIDCHVVELNATVKNRGEMLDSTFERLVTQINDAMYSAIVTVNYEAAKMIMEHYDELSRDIPVIFAGLGRVPPDLKRLYPNSTAISIADDTSGTIELALKLFPEAQNLALVVDDTTISEETRNDILSKSKQHFPQLDYFWVNAEMERHAIQNKLADLPDETLILFFPTHDYANGHNETLSAFVQNIGFDRRFPCLALDDTLLGNGVVAGSMIETHKLGHEAARMAAQVLNIGSAARVAEKTITPRKYVDYEKFNSYKAFSGSIPLGISVINKPETVWTRHWQTILTILSVALAIGVLQIIYISWMRRKLRTNRNMLYSLPGRVMVLNRAENILFASWIKDNLREKGRAPKKLENLTGIDYPKLSQAVHDVFQTGRQTTIEYNYEDVHRAISFAPLEQGIFGQDAVICFSLDNTELQVARREAEKYSAQLKKNTRMWDILINFLPLHIYAKDIDNDFRYVFNNRTRCKFYGAGENELNDKTDFDYLPHDLAQEMHKKDEEFVAQTGLTTQERNVDVKSWDGRMQHLRNIQRIFTDEDGTRLLLGASVNITELEEARIQMQQLNAKMQELLEQHSVLLDNMTSLVLTKDVDNDFRITTCNEACLKFLNKKMSDMIGKTDFDILGREDAEIIREEDQHAIEVLEFRPEYHSTGTLRDLTGRSRIGRFVRKLIRTADGHRILFTLFHDVTDLENAKREAEENADRFLLTLRSIGDGVIATDNNGAVTLVNPNAETLLGCKQDAMLGKQHADFFRIVNEQTGKPISSPLAAALRSGIVTEGSDQTDLISASGRRYHIAASAAPIRKRSGELAGAILVFRDITDERNKREELRQAMANMENASEMARLAFFRFELNTRKRTGSTMLRTLWPDDENGEPMRFEDWVYPDDVAIFAREEGTLEQSGKHGTSTTFSFRVGQADSLRYYRAMITLDLSSPDDPSVFGILQDVTELSQSMLKLKDTQALWDAAINAIPIMFTVKDIDDDFRYLLCNNAFAEIFNLTTQDIVGRTDREVFQGNDEVIQIAGRMNNSAQETEATESFEEGLLDPNGRRHYIKTVTRVIQDTGGRRLLLAASSDVTDMQNLLVIERINSELLSHFNREPAYERVLDRLAGTLRKELGCSRIVVASREDNGVFTITRQWHYDGLRPVRMPQVLLRKLGWEKRVQESPFGSVIRIDDFPEFARAIGLNMDRGAGDGKLESSFVSSPIYENNKLIGGLFLSFLQDRREFADLDETIITSCAGIVSLARQRERSQEAVRRALVENQMILDNIDIPIWLFNTENVLIRTNAAVAKIADRPHPIVNPAENERVFRDFTADLKTTALDQKLSSGASRRQSTTYRGQDYIIATESVRDNRGNQLYNMKYAVDVTTLNRLIQNQKFVNETLEDIIGEDDFDESIRKTLENVCRLIGASRGCLLQHEETGTKAHCVSEYVESKHPHADFKMFDRTLSRVCGILENTPDGRTFVCSDMLAFDWGFVENDWRQAAKAIELRAIFLSNIVCNGEVWGTVAFNFEGIQHTFSENDITLLRATAHMIELVLSRKRAKALIMDALERAQAADRAKSFFIASVSHEIRTPLNSVIGFAELLREGGVSEAQQTEYLSAISSSANALLMLINDVLDLSKLEANQMQIITAFTDFNALCREVLLIFTFRAQENSNKLVFDVPDMPELDIDNIRVRQILINLLGNAVKFTKKGSITLLASFTPDSPESGTLSFAVRDTGIGISEDDQKKLMEPFVQLSKLRGTNAVNNGTGLGLSISKRLASCMNGELTCTSEVGKGSTFGVTLHGVHYRAKTAETRKQQVKAVASAAQKDLSAINILVVDDVPMNLRVAKAIFAKIGYKNVFTAESGKEALKLIEKQPVDLILSDMWMPEMNGAQLSAEIKHNPKFEHIPIVAQTADVETSGNFDMSNFDAIILKPITGEKLSNMVQRVMGGGDDDDANAPHDGPINLG